MSCGRYDCRVLKASLIALALIVAFGLVFALLPGGSGSRDRTGVVLRGVQLKLFPGQDPDAEWRFTAPELRFDPIKNESTVSGLKVGERWIRDPKTGGQVLDMTMQAAQLRIDENGNLRTDQAELYLVADCMNLVMRGQANQPVLIDQNAGYTTPYAKITSPTINGEYNNVAASFDLKRFVAEQRPGAEVDPAPNIQCVNGKAIPKTSNTSVPRRPS